MNFDFHPDHKNPSAFLQCIDSRAVRHEVIDGEAMKSIIDQHGGMEQLAVALSMDLVANSNQQSKIPS